MQKKRRIKSSKKIYDFGMGRCSIVEIIYFGSEKYELLKICQVRHKTCKRDFEKLPSWIVFGLKSFNDQKVLWIKRKQISCLQNCGNEIFD